MKNPIIKAVAVGLVVPFCLENKPHLDVAHVTSEPLPSSPFVQVSTATARILPNLWSEWLLEEPR